MHRDDFSLADEQHISLLSGVCTDGEKQNLGFY